MLHESAFQSRQEPIEANPLRSRRELSYRFRQEVANLVLLANPPSAALQPMSRLPCLPDPAAVAHACRDTAYAADVIRLAELVLQRRFPLLGTFLETGPDIDWRRDYQRGVTSRASYHRLIPYLDATRVGDHKIIWELNRHQHLVLLAQAFRVTDRQQFVDDIWAQLVSWWSANPFMRGINWASALEVAFRTLSWIWVYHLAGSRMPSQVHTRFICSLYQHGCYLERNLSTYYSPNTHLLGEAVALHALGRLFPGFPGAARWEASGGALVAQQMDHQVRGDGTHFEQATYYHLYATDLFLFHAVLANPEQSFRNKLEQMAEFIAAVSGHSRVLPLIGDDDGGRVFHPYGSRDRFGRATLASCGVLFDRPEWVPDRDDLREQSAWWLGEDARPSRDTSGPREGTREAGSRLFPDAGVAILTSGQIQVIVDVGPFGTGGAGHSHSDTLSLVVRRGVEEILIDPGTYTYVDPDTRRRFRGSAAHNTVQIDGIDQAIQRNMFRWENPPRVELLRFMTTPTYDFVEARCCYTGLELADEVSFSHGRSVLLLKSQSTTGGVGLLFVCDRVDGPNGEHVLEQFWHPGESTVVGTPQLARIGNHACLVVPPGEHIEREVGGHVGWRSTCFGQRDEAVVLAIRRRTTLPACCWTVVDLSGAAVAPTLETDSQRWDRCRYVNETRIIDVCLSDPVLLREGPVG
jgi:hypothetical protein